MGMLIEFDAITIITSLLLMFLSLFALAHCARPTCSIERGSIDVTSNRVTCKDQDGQEISQSLDENDQAIEVIGDSNNNFITISASNLDIFFTCSHIQAISAEDKSAIKVNSNSDVTIHINGVGLFDGSKHGIGCEGGSIIRIKGNKSSFVRASALLGTALGVIDSKCKLIELDGVIGEFKQLRSTESSSQPQGAAIGSGELNNVFSFVERIIINNSNIKASVMSRYHGAIGGNTNEIIIENSKVDGTTDLADKGRPVIGANHLFNISTISIECSNITELAGPESTAIGAFKGGFNELTITDSTVNCIGGTGASAIGSSKDGGGFDSITFERSTVLAYVEGNAAIGSAENSPIIGNISIITSEVTAKTRGVNVQAIGRKGESTITIDCSEVIAEATSSGSYALGSVDGSKNLVIRGGYVSATNPDGTTLYVNSYKNGDGDGFSPDILSKISVSKKDECETIVKGNHACFLNGEIVEIPCAGDVADPDLSQKPNPENPSLKPDQNDSNNSNNNDKDKDKDKDTKTVAIVVPIVVVIIIIVAAIIIIICKRRIT